MLRLAKPPYKLMHPNDCMINLVYVLWKLVSWLSMWHFRQINECSGLLIKALLSETTERRKRGKESWDPAEYRRSCADRHKCDSGSFCVANGRKPEATSKHYNYHPGSRLTVMCPEYIRSHSTNLELQVCPNHIESEHMNTTASASSIEHHCEGVLSTCESPMDHVEPSPQERYYNQPGNNLHAKRAETRRKCAAVIIYDGYVARGQFNSGCSMQSFKSSLDTISLRAHDT